MAARSLQRASYSTSGIWMPTFSGLTMIAPRLRWPAAPSRQSPSCGRHAAVIFPYRALRYRPAMPRLDLQRLALGSLVALVCAALIFTSVGAAS
jgi:hypothetical protein